MKYIVYKTTNTVNGKIYIGIHKTEDPYNFDGYLGNGVMIHDKHTYIKCLTPFESAVNKYGVQSFSRETLFVYDTIEEALSKEREIVDEDFILRKDTYNITVGGGIPPVQVKIVYQYTMDGDYIKEWESITAASNYYKCSSMSIGSAVLDKTPSLGYLWSDVKCDKIDISQYKIDANKQKCFLYDKDGYFIDEFKSMKECSDYTGILRTTIGKGLKTGRMIHRKYYVLKYKTERYIPIVEEKYTIAYKYDMDGNYICPIYEFNYWINNSIRMNQSSKGFRYSLQKVDKLQFERKYIRKVGQYSLEGNLIKIYNSVIEAKKDFPSCTRALYANGKQASGFVWKFLD